MTTKVAADKEHPEFSYRFFILSNTLISIGIVFVIWLTVPNAVWQTQINSEAWRYIFVFMIIKLFNGFLEFFFHRYVLHKPTFKILSWFCTSHRRHHALTSIQRRKTPGGKDMYYIVNNYPITTKKQDEASFFPWYSLIVFSIVISPLLITLQYIFPTLPWLFGGNIALLASLTLYEFIHAVEHWPLERWDKLLDHPRFGKLFHKAYSFHLRHHAVVDCNESISGFFTLPITDIVFGTMVLPKGLYTTGDSFDSSEFEKPIPCVFIKWLDRITDERIKQREHIT